MITIEMLTAAFVFYAMGLGASWFLGYVKEFGWAKVALAQLAMVLLALLTASWIVG